MKKRTIAASLALLSVAFAGSVQAWEMPEHEPTLFQYCNGEIRTCPYEGDLTIDTLAEALTAWTGIQFDVRVNETYSGIYVAWNEESTLLAGADLEKLGYSSLQELQWDILDTMEANIRYNFGYGNIWFVAADGYNLHLEDEILSYHPYVGSEYFKEYGISAESAEEAQLILEKYLSDTGAENTAVSLADTFELTDDYGYCFDLDGASEGKSYVVFSEGLLFSATSDHAFLEVMVPEESPFYMTYELAETDHGYELREMMEWAYEYDDYAEDPEIDLTEDYDAYYDLDYDDPNYGELNEDNHIEIITVEETGEQIGFLLDTELDLAEQADEEELGLTVDSEELESMDDYADIDEDMAYMEYEIDENPWKLCEDAEEAEELAGFASVFQPELLEKRFKAQDFWAKADDMIEIVYTDKENEKIVLRQAAEEDREIRPENIEDAEWTEETDGEIGSISVETKGLDGLVHEAFFHVDGFSCYLLAENGITWEELESFFLNDLIETEKKDIAEN